MSFPVDRPRRLRSSITMRRMVRETHLTAEDFVYPLFVCPGEGVKQEIEAMPGKYQMSVDEVVEECREVRSLGIPGVILFGLPETKDLEASEAYDDDGTIQRAIRAIKVEVEDLIVISDCCLCSYTSHGHCGQIEGGDVDNDLTLKLLAKTALSQARAGVDIIAPSDMMDGRIGVIRETLDCNDFAGLPILAYAAKYASGFYGPFREAAKSAPQFGDRNSYQMDPANQREAMREIELDIDEGADMIMVKPAMPYLDVIYRAKQEFDIPVAAYQVSGEFSMIVSAGQNGWIDQQRVMMESLTSIKRAGADLILTYFAKDAVGLL